MSFSDEVAVRAAVRVQDGELVAAPFDANDRQTESAIWFGPIAGMDIEERFAHIRFVFDVDRIEG